LITCLVPVLLAVFFLIAFFIVYPDSFWESVGFAASVLLISSLLMYLRKFRLDITSGGISYSGPFSGIRFINYREISAATVIDYGLSPWRGILTATLVVTPKEAAKEALLKIPLTFFPREARANLEGLLQPQVLRQP
jgi:hypothetical protein